MNQHLVDLQSLALIDQQCSLNQTIEKERLSRAEYQLVRRVIQQTGDWEYQSLLRFEEHALDKGAAALAGRVPIVVDLLMVQAGISACLETTFVNPVYCAQSLTARKQKDKSALAVSMEILAQRYPEAIFIVGQDQEVLLTLLEFIEINKIQPSLVIATTANFIDAEVTKKRLQDSLIPQITVDGPKGNVVVAVTLFNALADLAWQAYEQNDYNLNYIRNFLEFNTNQKSK